MRLVRKIVKWMGIILLGLIVVGAGYQQIGLALDARLNPPVSEMIPVDGRMVHIICAGKGARTFLLDAGAGAWSFEWFRLQPLLAKAGRTCAFDRAGSGWSEGSNAGFDGSSKADELASVLNAAQIPKPFFYVGHSLGANFAQIYYAKHPADIAGLILIEPGDPKDLLEDTTGTREAVMSARDCTAICYFAGALSYVGVTRLAASLTIGKKTLSPSVRELYVAGLGRSSTVMATVAYLQSVPKTAYQDLDVSSFGDTPVLVFDSTLPRSPEGKETVADVTIWKQGQLKFLAALAAKSTHGNGPVHIPDSTHSTMVMGEPQAAFVAQAIIDFAERASGPAVSDVLTR